MISRFTYFKPHNLNEAVQYLEKEEKSFVLAGGTDIMILLRRNLINAEHIVDIKALPETAAFEFVEGAGLTIGASVVVNRVVTRKLSKLNTRHCTRLPHPWLLSNSATVPPWWETSAMLLQARTCHLRCWFTTLWLTSPDLKATVRSRCTSFSLV